LETLKVTHSAPRAPIFSLIEAEPTAFGVDLISGGKRELLPGGVFGPVASEVSAMMRKVKAGIQWMRKDSEVRFYARITLLSRHFKTTIAIT